MQYARAYAPIFLEHLLQERKMLFVAGPRQVGKTTVCRNLIAGAKYLNWDDETDRRLITQGVPTIAKALGLSELRSGIVTVVFDELHKYRRWKIFSKALFDKHGQHLNIVVTGSARLDVYRRGGDSLMGRYFLYHMHPFGVGELVHPTRTSELVAKPRPIADDLWQRLWTHGGFPEPFSRGETRFSNRWRLLRRQQLVREDIRDLTRIQEIDQLAMLVTTLEAHTTAQLNYSTLATQINVSVDTIRRWISTLVSLHHGFVIRPWFRNISKALRKEPRYYVRDWSLLGDAGARSETLVACHLFKAVETWQDAGLGEFELRYLRDKAKREVDFVVIRDGKPWFLVEVKHSDRGLSPALKYFQTQTGAAHAFQVVIDMPFVAQDAFSVTEPVVVPARTFLSQLP
jgi:uncharacterized protein